MEQNNYPKAYVPNPGVIERTPNGERQYDIYSRLLVDRIVYFGTEVNSVTANLIIGQLLFLSQQDPEAPIHMYINSPGGSVYDGLGVYDVMQMIPCPVYTYCAGLAASMGSLLLAGGAKGHRYSLPNSRIMIHQPLGGARGQASDIQIQAKEIQELKEKLYGIYVHHSSTNLTLDDYTRLCDRDNFLSPEKAIELGLIDSIMPKQPHK